MPSIPFLMPQVRNIQLRFLTRMLRVWLARVVVNTAASPVQEVPVASLLPTADETCVNGKLDFRVSDTTDDRSGGGLNFRVAW